MTIYMGTTKIPPEKTAAEIQSLLASKGAHNVLTEYDKGEVVAISFAINIRNKEVAFCLPVRWENYFKALQNEYQRKWDRRRASPKEDQAKRTAWRVVLRWVQAQFALIETDMASLDEVMLPYALVENETFYERLLKDNFKLLEAPK